MGNEGQSDPSETHGQQVHLHWDIPVCTPLPCQPSLQTSGDVFPLGVLSENSSTVRNYRIQMKTVYFNLSRIHLLREKKLEQPQGANIHLNVRLQREQR